MVDTGFVEATDKIVLSGNPITVEKEIKTVADMKPGRLVQRDTTDNQIKVSTDDDHVYGWLAYEHTPVMYRPANKDTIYVVKDRVGVIVGGEVVIRAQLASGQSVSMGDKLTAAAAGELTAATLATDMVVATAMETVDASDSALKIIVKSRI